MHEDEVDLRWLLGVLRRRMHVILMTTAVVMLVVTALLLILPPRYTATVELLIDPREQKVVSSDAVLPGLGGDSSVIDSQVEILRSTRIAQTIIRKFGLFDVDSGSAVVTPAATAKASRASSRLTPRRRMVTRVAGSCPVAIEIS